jgi:hypothetical protein
MGLDKNPATVRHFPIPRFPAELDPQHAASATAVRSAMDPIIRSALPSGTSLDNPIGAKATEPEPVSPASDTMAACFQTPPTSKTKPGNAARQVGSSNMRKTGNEDSDVAVIADGPKSPPLSRSRQKRKNKFQSTDEDKVHTGTILVKVCSMMFVYES